MIPAPIPANELKRLAALLKLKLLDTNANPAFDALTRSLARATGAPIALLSLVDAERQWFMCRVGIDARETPRAISFCGHAIMARRPFVIGDALADERFADNPLVLGPPHVRAYLGMPLLTAEEGAALGTLCAIDTKAREWSRDEIAITTDLAYVATTLIEACAYKQELGESFAALANMFKTAPAA